MAGVFVGCNGVPVASYRNQPTPALFLNILERRAWRAFGDVALSSPEEALLRPAPKHA